MRYCEHGRVPFRDACERCNQVSGRYDRDWIDQRYGIYFGRYLPRGRHTGAPSGGGRDDSHQWDGRNTQGHTDSQIQTQTQGGMQTQGQGNVLAQGDTLPRGGTQNHVIPSQGEGQMNALANAQTNA